MRVRVRFMVLLCVPLILPAAAFAASTAGGASLQIPPDVRAEGMGRVWAPLATSPYAAWSNVGGLGLLEGAQFVKTDVHLIPDVVPDVYYDYYAIVLGYSPRVLPVPLSFSIGYNRTDLDYGESFATSPDSPDPIGTFRSYENVDGFTFALGIADLVGVGVGVKTLNVNLAPEEFAGAGAGKGKTKAVDYGILARSPYLVIDPGTESPLSFSRRADGPVSFRAVGGVAVSNRGDGISLVDTRQSDPLPKVRRESIGAELQFVPVSPHLNVQGKILQRLLRDAHVLTVSAALGRDDSLIDEAIPDSIAARLSKNEREGIVTYDGFEIRLFDVVSYRRGSIFDDPGEIKGTTEGWGMSFLGYVGVDYAEIPQFRELERRKLWSFWVRVPLDWF